ncbi:hypothetical protein P9126_19455 [Bacillus glycinifermentans]|uniref:hypothetical protein n=1 Tax=Bacillus glycinifermentans TaxID=1664069 RepID=UPI002DBD9F08|nr:hypothetical protein [Bacillus glycinifermentans]MEC3609144.1 hypothetical protein [Bacillus glycinifermentans]
MENETELFHSYLTLWKNRTVHGDRKRALDQAIDDELNDLRTHPSLRKTRFEKYAQAVQRIISSPLEADIKLELIARHTERLQLLTNKESRE